MVLDVRRVQALLGGCPFGAILQYEASVGSTMDVARSAAREGAPHGLVVVADEQTAGRGRFGRRWVAPAGANLTFTILVRPDRGRLERLSVIAALAVADGVCEAAGVDARFKWPNDLQVDGKKLAGILVESELTGERPAFALVGIGLNVNAETAAVAEIREIAVSLRDILRQATEREALLAAVLRAFDRWYQCDEAQPVIAAWSERLATLGQAVRVTFAGQAEEGVAESVTESGALKLRRTDGSVVELPAGEVTMRGVTDLSPDPSPTRRGVPRQAPPDCSSDGSPQPVL
jgi:BirA family transcriptional regulator, biotin operon repressor / biotin---[acetyl-CoA-carboxylase] ligase